MSDLYDLAFRFRDRCGRCTDRKCDWCEAADAVSKLDMAEMAYKVAAKEIGHLMSKLSAIAKLLDDWEQAVEMDLGVDIEVGIHQIRELLKDD